MDTDSNTSSVVRATPNSPLTCAAAASANSSAGNTMPSGSIQSKVWVASSMKGASHTRLPGIQVRFSVEVRTHGLSDHDVLQLIGSFYVRVTPLSRRKHGQNRCSEGGT